MSAKWSALFAALAYLGFSFVIRGGASFRADPIAIVLVLAAFDLVVLRQARIRRTVLARALFGLGGMVTIKATIFFPSFLIILILPLFTTKDRSAEFLRAGRTPSALIAQADPLVVRQHTTSVPFRADYFEESVRRQLTEMISESGF